jgi:hypothetical protein
VSGETSEDRDLVERVAAGDRWALRALYLAYFPRLAAFLSHLTTAPAEDLINDILLDVWRFAASGEAQESIHVWIMQLALRHAGLHPPLFAPRAGTSRKAALLANLSLEERAAMHLVYTGHTRSQVMQILGAGEAEMDRLLTGARVACARKGHFAALGSSSRHSL